MDESAARVLVHTPYPLDPMLVRLETAVQTLRAAGYFVRIAPFKSLRGGWLLNAACWRYFDLARIAVSWSSLGGADLIYVQDLRLAPLLCLARLRGKRTLYETLDHGPSYHDYQLRCHGHWSPAWVRDLVARAERWLARRMAHAVIVNSESLKAYFSGRALYLPYTSPFEDFPVPAAAEREPALLYLGVFSCEKGARAMLQLQRETGRPLFIFGEIAGAEIRKELDRQAAVSIHPRLCSAELREQLLQLRARFDLVGLSLIEPVHHSYATQEANKDIDYLALGLPIIGNHRATTAEKIEAGCGVFYDDQDAVTQLLQEPAFRHGLAARSRAHYERHYAFGLYRTQLLNCIRSVLA